MRREGGDAERVGRPGGAAHSRRGEGEIGNETPARLQPDFAQRIRMSLARFPQNHSEAIPVAIVTARACIIINFVCRLSNFFFFPVYLPVCVHFGL